MPFFSFSRTPTADMPAALSPRRVKAERFIRLRQICYLWTFIFSGIALALLLVTMRRRPHVGSLAVFVLSIGINVAVMVYCFMLNFWAVVFQRRSAKEANQTKIVKRKTILFHWVITVVVTVMFALLVRFYPAPKCNGKDGVWSSTVVGKPDPAFKKQCSIYLAGWTIYGFELIGAFVGSMLVLVTNPITRWAENEDDLAARQARIDEKKRAVVTASTPTPSVATAATPSTASRVAPSLQSPSKPSSAHPSRAPTIHSQHTPPMHQQRPGGSTVKQPIVESYHTSSSHRSSPLATQPVIVSHRPSPLVTSPVITSHISSPRSPSPRATSPLMASHMSSPRSPSPRATSPLMTNHVSSPLATQPAIVSHASRQPVTPPAITGDSHYTKVAPRPAQAGPRRGTNYI